MPRSRSSDRTDPLRWTRIVASWDRSTYADWLVPAVAVALWSVALRETASLALPAARSIVFLGMPLVLLAGLHARITGYLHAPARHQLLVLPIAPGVHFWAAWRRHMRGLMVTVALGALGLGLAVGRAGWTRGELGLLVDLGVVGVTSVAVEPGIAAVSAWLGRRFPAGSSVGQLQQSLGGGFTLPEAVVHLYAPAFGLGLAVTLAMPGQLLVDRLVDGASVPSGLWVLSVGAVAVAVAVLAAAPWVYAAAVFEAVPFVAEATRTLAGPPAAEPAPRWVRRLSDPVVRVLVLQFLRQTPLPALRLAIVMAAAAWLGLRAADTTGPTAALGLGAVGLWLVPARTLSGGAAARARLFAGLPLGPAKIRRGALVAQTLLIAPAVLVAGVIAARWSAA